MQKTQLQLLALVAAALVSANTAMAASFDPTDAGLLLSNTIPDLDLFLLSQFVGAVPGQTLSYGATVSSTGYSQSLTGAYGGASLAVNYTATVDQNAPSGSRIALSSVGIYASSSEISGYNTTFQYLDNTGTTFQVGINGFFTVGANTADLDLTILGDNNSGLLTFTGTSGTVNVDGQVTAIPLGSSFIGVGIAGVIYPSFPFVTYSCVPGYNSVNSAHPCMGSSLVVNTGMEATNNFHFWSVGGTVSTPTPEPASFALMLISLGWLARKWIAHGHVS